MTKLQRVVRVLTGIIMIVAAYMMYTYPSEGLLVIIAILSASFTIAGITDILRYFFMTRYMVGGRQILYRGVIALNFGIFAASLSSSPKLYIALYLTGMYMFAGAVDVLHGVQAKHLGGQWKFITVEGAIEILLGAACIVCIGSAQILVSLYCIGLLYRAFTRIASAFRRTAVIFIQ